MRRGINLAIVYLYHLLDRVLLLYLFVLVPQRDLFVDVGVVKVGLLRGAFVLNLVLPLALNLLLCAHSCFHLEI